MFLFIAVVLIAAGGINSYVFIRGLQAIPVDSGFRIPYIILFWVVAASFFAGRILEGFWHCFLSDLLIWVGSFWMAALLYFLLSVFILDVLRCVHHFLPCFPSFVTANYPAAKRTIALGLSILVCLILAAGYVNSIFPKVRTLNISIDKEAGDLKTLNIVAVSDIHLGTIVGRARLSGIVDRINSLNPDAVLLPGDIVDEDMTNAGKSHLGDPLKNIRSRYGVFAATGNHEYIAGILEAISFLEAQNITLLQDQSIKVADAFYLLGRKDSSAARFRGAGRKKVDELMRSVDKTYPVILMDHQPFRLAEAAEAGVDLQLSGHTHDGQLWPVNYIVGSIFELAWGYEKIGNTHFYVSNGVGTWGPPVRIGNRPEIVQIHLQFKYN